MPGGNKRSNILNLTKSSNPKNDKSFLNEVTRLSKVGNQYILIKTGKTLDKSAWSLE